jgi:hypothetical protein
MNNVVFIDKFKKGVAPMIKFTFKELNSMVFNNALDELVKQPTLANFKATYNVARIKRQLSNEMQTAKELYIKLSNDYHAKDEKGEFIPTEIPNPHSPFKIVEGKEEEFSQKMEDFLSTEVTLESYPVTEADLVNVKLSPQQLMALEPILDPAVFSPGAEAPQTV